MDVKIPVNCRATLVLPPEYSKDVTLDGKPIEEKAVLEFGSGEYTVTSQRNK